MRNVRDTYVDSKEKEKEKRKRLEKEPAADRENKKDEFRISMCNQKPDFQHKTRHESHGKH